MQEKENLQLGIFKKNWSLWDTKKYFWTCRNKNKFPFWF